MGRGCEVNVWGEMEIFDGIKATFMLPDSSNLNSS